jgi:hypothetical protein
MPGKSPLQDTWNRTMSLFRLARYREVAAGVSLVRYNETPKSVDAPVVNHHSDAHIFAEDAFSFSMNFLAALSLLVISGGSKTNNGCLRSVLVVFLKDNRAPVVFCSL